MVIARGKPAGYGHELVKRRYRLTKQWLNFQGKTVLDFGCGNGAQTKEFGNEGCRLIAVDVASEQLAMFRKNLAVCTDTILPVQYDGWRLPLRNESIDLALSYEVLEHVPDESLALSEIHRVLRPGGDFVLSVPNKWWIFETHGADLPLLPWNRVPFFSWLPRVVHSRYARARIYRKNEITKLLQHNGFQMHAAVYITAPLDVLRIPVLQKLFRSLVFRGDVTTLPVLSTSILIHCTKPDQVHRDNSRK